MDGDLQEGGLLSRETVRADSEEESSDTMFVGNNLRVMERK